MPSTNLNKKSAAIEPVGFIVGSKNIYLTTSHGRLIIIDIATGKPTSVIKIDNDTIFFILKPK